jgi:serine/threonine-protein kinase RsbW
MRPSELTLVIDSRLELVRGLAGAARGFFEEMGLGAAFELELCLVEAVNNAIEHAYANEPGHEVVVALRADDGGVTMTVADRGRAMDSAVLEGPRSTVTPTPEGEHAALQERGMGLALIKELLEVDYVADGGLHRLVMRRPTQCRAEPIAHGDAELAS